MRFIAGIFFALVLFAAPIAHSADISVVTFDLQQVVEKSVPVKEAYVELEKKLSPVKKTLEKERKELEVKASILSDPKASKADRDAFITRQTAYLEKANTLVRQLGEAEMSVRTQMDAVIIQAARDYGTRNKHDLVLDAMGVMFQNSSLKFPDVTSAMVEEVNKVWAAAKKK